MHARTGRTHDHHRHHLSGREAAEAARDDGPVEGQVDQVLRDGGGGHEGEVRPALPQQDVVGAAVSLSLSVSVSLLEGVA